MKKPIKFLYKVVLLSSFLICILVTNELFINDKTETLIKLAQNLVIDCKQSVVNLMKNS